MKKFMLMLSLLFAVAGGAHAAAQTPDGVVKEGTDKLQTLISQNHAKYKADLPGFYKVVDGIAVEYFDVPFIAKTVLARNYKAATPDQRKRFQEAFKNMLIRSYADAMLENYDSVKVEWKPVRMADGATDATVNTSLLRNGKPPVGIGFSMRLVSDDWKIADITIENLSLVQNFRGQFASELKKNDLNSLITRMEGGQFSTDTPKSGAAQK